MIWTSGGASRLAILIVGLPGVTLFVEGMSQLLLLLEPGTDLIVHRLLCHDLLPLSGLSDALLGMTFLVDMPPGTEGPSIQIGLVRLGRLNTVMDAFGLIPAIEYLPVRTDLMSLMRILKTKMS